MKEKEQWINDVFESTKGMKRARPNAGLFAKIERGVRQVEAKVVPFRRLQIAAAAAVLLMVLNITALSQYANSVENEVSELTKIEPSETPLISNFNLYE